MFYILLNALLHDKYVCFDCEIRNEFVHRCRFIFIFDLFFFSTFYLFFPVTVVLDAFIVVVAVVVSDENGYG